MAPGAPCATSSQSPSLRTLEEGTEPKALTDRVTDENVGLLELGGDGGFITLKLCLCPSLILHSVALSVDAP